MNPMIFILAPFLCAMWCNNRENQKVAPSKEKTETIAPIFSILPPYVKLLIVFLLLYALFQIGFHFKDVAFFVYENLTSVSYFPHDTKINEVDFMKLFDFSSWEAIKQTLIGKLWSGITLQNPLDLAFALSIMIPYFTMVIVFKMVFDTIKYTKHNTRKTNEQ